MKSPSTTTDALSEQLAITTLNDAANIERLKQVLDDASVDLEEVENFRPTAAAAKKGLPYNWSLALQPINVAKKVIRRAGTLLQSSSQTSKRNPIETATQARRNIPEVKITPFSGDVVAYMSFMTAFKLKFDTLPIPDREKLQHLKENLTGNPLRAIRALDLTDANYSRALADLDKQYNKPDDVIDALYSKLESLPQSSNSNADLIATYFEVEGILSALESHGHSLDSFPPLKKKVYKKYPSWLVNQGCAKGLLPVKDFQDEVAKTLSIRSSLNSGDFSQTEGCSSTFHANPIRSQNSCNDENDPTGAPQDQEIFVNQD